MSENPSMLVLVCTCGQKMKIPEASLGKTFKCVRCGAHMKSDSGNASSFGAVAPSTSPDLVPGDSASVTEKNSTPIAQEPIGQMLVEGGVITEAQLQDALSKQKMQGGKTFELLIALGHLDKDALHDFLSQQPGIATIDLSRFNIEQKLVELVPKKLAIESLVLPIDQLGKLLTVAMACPFDIATIATLEKLTGLRVKAMLCKLEDIHAAVKKYYPDRSRSEMSSSSFDKILGAAEGPKEKVEGKVAIWEGAFIEEARLSALREVVSTETSLEVIAKSVLDEPGLCPFVMRVANSSIYGMGGRIDSVPMAIAVIGQEGLQAILENVVEPQSAKLVAPLEPLFQQFRRTAAIAQGLARECGVMGENAACSLGMLGELGRFALFTISPLKYKRVKMLFHGAELAKAEQRFFSMDHLAVAGTLTAAWHFPASLGKALSHYVCPDEAEGAESVARLLGVALALSYAKPDDVNTTIKDIGDSLSALNLTPQAVSQVVSEAPAPFGGGGAGGVK